MKPKYRNDPKKLQAIFGLFAMAIIARHQGRIGQPFRLAPKRFYGPRGTMWVKHRTEDRLVRRPNPRRI